VEEDLYGQKENPAEVERFKIGLKSFFVENLKVHYFELTEDKMKSLTSKESSIGAAVMATAWRLWRRCRRPSTMTQGSP
jgi:hypothetical protein